MAKKNSRNPKKTANAMSQSRFVVERAHDFPVGECYISEGYDDGARSVTAIVTRKRSNGNLMFACFKIDPYCRGVVEATAAASIDVATLGSFIEEVGLHDSLMKVDYATVHNYVLGAVEFAEEGGLSPAAGYTVASHLLEDDSDEIELIEFSYGGSDGRHTLFADDDPPIGVIHTLEETLGKDGIVVVYSNSEIEKMRKGLVTEAFSRRTFTYPSVLDPSVFPPGFITRIFSPERLPAELLRSSAALDPSSRRKLISDLDYIMMFKLGLLVGEEADSERPKPADESENAGINDASLINILAMMLEMKDPSAVDSILRLLSHSGKLLAVDYDALVAEAAIPALVYSADPGSLDAIEKFLATPGIDSRIREQVIMALGDLVILHPPMKARIAAICATLSRRHLDLLPGKCEAADSASAGALVYLAGILGERSTDITAAAILDAGFADLCICGNITSEEYLARRAEHDAGLCGAEPEPCGIEMPNSAEELYDQAGFPPESETPIV